MKMEDRYIIIYLCIYLISVGGNSLPIDSNKNTCKVNTPIYRKNRQVENFNLQVLEKNSNVYNSTTDFWQI